MDYGAELAVQSFCFRGFEDNAAVAQMVRDIGLDRIELCGKHADFADEPTFDDVIGTYRDAGVDIVSIGVQGCNGKKEDERPYFEFAKRAGCSTISVNFSPGTVPEGFRVAEELADEYNINLGIHNHGGRHWLGSAQMLAHVFSQTGPRIGLMLDTAWALDAREDPVALVRKFGDRTHGIHVKDFIFDRARAPEDVVVGTGNLDLPELFTALDDIGFAGNLILEYEGDVDNPVPALSECVKAVRNVV